MIEIRVSDAAEEERLVSLHKDGKLDLGGLPYVIRAKRGDRWASIGGASPGNTVHYTGTAPAFTAGGGGGTGSTNIAR